jgi:hypothetical protein
VRPTVRPFSGTRGAAGGFGKWTGGLLAGLGALLAGLFHAIFGSGTKEKAKEKGAWGKQILPAAKKPAPAHRVNQMALGTDGKDGVWLREVAAAEEWLLRRR